MNSESLTYAVRVQVSAILVALITAGAFVAIPLPGSPVPMVLQNMFVILTGLILPPLAAMGTIGVYLFLGAIGLPIFSGASGGLAHLAGPTGGFLLGYIPAAAITAVIAHGGSRGAARIALALTAGFLMVYVVGVPFLARILEIPLNRAIVVGMLPFLPGDLIKAIVLAGLVKTIPPSVWRSWS